LLGGSYTVELRELKKMASARFMYALLCGFASSLCTEAVVAQTAAQNAAASDTELAEVIVTATRRSESVQNVAGQVMALTSGTLGQINARDFNDFAALVPGLSYASTGPSTNLLVIRGITTGSQLSSATGVYLDDIPLGASTSNGIGYQSLNVNVFDLNRVEVLNGPQGTLYGATSLGGTVKYISNLPDLKEFSIEAGRRFLPPSTAALITPTPACSTCRSAMGSVQCASMAIRCMTPAMRKIRFTTATTKAGTDPKAAESRSDTACQCSSLHPVC
jgi:outer membrane receptor for Fe3+-dicitrate